MRVAKRFLSLAAMAAMSAPSYAGELRRSDLPANTAMVVHVDWDAARTSPPMVKLSEQISAGLASGGFVGPAAVKLIAGGTLHDMTLVVTESGSTFQVVRGEVDVAGLKGIFAEADDYVVVHHGEHEIHHWVGVPKAFDQADDQEAAKSEDPPSAIYAAVCPDGTYIISEQLKAIVEALARRDGAGEQISDKAFAALKYEIPANTMIQIHARSAGSLESIVPGLPLTSGRAIISVDGAVCEMNCDVDFNNAMIASTLANVLKPENLVTMLQGYAAQAAGAKAPEHAEQPKPNDGKRALNLGFGIKNMDEKDTRELITKAIQATADGTRLHVHFRGVLEPVVEVKPQALSISLQLDGAKTQTAGKDETIR